MARPKKVETSEDQVVTPTEQTEETVAVPAEDTVGHDVSEEQMEQVKAVVSDEETFLRKILDVQHTGGFGRHLDHLIYERLKEIKK